MACSKNNTGEKEYAITFQFVSDEWDVRDVICFEALVLFFAQ